MNLGNKECPNPHAYILLWLHEDFKIRNQADVDQLICAEIPNQNKHPKSYHIIKNHTMQDYAALKIQNHIV